MFRPAKIIPDPGKSSRSDRIRIHNTESNCIFNISVVAAESSDDDDLIVVKTEYNTVDPITKKEIVDPVRNKRCNHVYERSTIHSMIDLAR